LPHRLAEKTTTLDGTGMSTQDYYQVLGVAKSADADAIKQAFRAQARKLHPDVSDDPDAGKKFSQLNEAYEVLSDPEKRAKYDQLGHERYVSGQPADHMNAQDIDFGDLGSIIDAMFGGSGRNSGGFRGGFGARQPRSHRPPPKGQDLRVSLRVSLSDVHHAASKRISVPGDEGYKSIEVKIPQGIKTGGKLRLKGQGLASPTRAGKPGDLFVMIHIEKDPRFARLDEGLDLQIELPLSIAEATLGAKVEVPTIDNKVVTLTIPPATVSESRFRIGGHGLASPSGDRGDLYAKVKIVPPSGAQLTDALKEALEELKQLPEAKPDAQDAFDNHASS
jgi:DnaJ-class molecular chaperone